MLAIVISVIYLGIGTATEAAAFGAFGALMIGLVMRRLSFKTIYESLMITTKQTEMIFTLVVGAHVFAYFGALTRVGNNILIAIEASGFPAWAILFQIVVMYLIMGMFMDLIGTML